MKISGTMLNIQYLNLEEGQYLKDIMAEIPKNIILSKTITGCGATTLEINSRRHSIIIEPNIPVILGKKKKHPEICPVFEDTSLKDVEDYLMAKICDHDSFAKIVTTPEGFKSKVLKAMDRNRAFPQRKFFLLFDECEKLVQDVDFRGKISLPMDDFFKFTNKAMVSATPIEPSDPRFKEQGFVIKKIRPQYNFKQEIHLCVTNRPRFALNRMIRYQLFIRNQGVICIFLNSVKTINSIIKQLDIKEQSKVFCSSNSFEKLTTQVDHDDKISGLKTFNFFTSRFYSAVDIDLTEKPHVIIYTDCNLQSTIVDPRTESAQICGRFRNGIKSVSHITNINPGLNWLKDTDTKQRLKYEEELYYQISNISIPPVEHLKNELIKALKSLRYHNFVTDEGARNYFMWDNECNWHKTLRTYTSSENLKMAYKVMFKPKLTEKKQLNEEERLNDRQTWIRVIENLNKLESSDSIKYRMIVKTFGLESIIVAYDTIGKEKIIELDYKVKEIEAAVKSHKQEYKILMPEIKVAVFERFQVGEKVPCSDMIDFLTNIFRQHNVKLENCKRIDRKIVAKFFDFKDGRINGNKTRVYHLINRRE